jgi:hypothetical protein
MYILEGWSSRIMTLCAYRLAETHELAFTAVPGKRRNATQRHMARECVISDNAH